MIYEGTCIGGPYAGMFYAAPSAAIRVLVFDPSAGLDDEATETFTYRHLRNEHGDWWVVA